MTEDRDHRGSKTRRDHLLTVKEYADLMRQHPLTVYRRIREGRQPGVHRVGTTIRLSPPGDDEEEEDEDEDES